LAIITAEVYFLLGEKRKVYSAFYDVINSLKELKSNILQTILIKL
jgi:hypothetical protein